MNNAFVKKRLKLSILFTFFILHVNITYIMYTYKIKTIKQKHQVILMPAVDAYWDFKHPTNLSHQNGGK